MRSFYRNKKIILPTLLVACTPPAIFSCILISNGNMLGIVFGLIYLFPFIYLVYFYLKKPVLKINGNMISAIKVFGGYNHIENPENYSLVVSGDFLSFRLEGENDIMVNKNSFNEIQWQELIGYLKSLNFKEVIQ